MMSAHFRSFPGPSFDCIINGGNFRTIMGSSEQRPEANGGRRLGSWKEIAAHLGVTDRTARRWESEEGLPVHRHWHDQRGTVWADAAELDAWRASRTVSRGDEARSSGQPESPHTHPASDKRKRIAVLLAAAVVLVGAALTLTVWQSPSRTGPQQLPVRGVMAGAPSGIHACPVISSDGRYIAYQSWEEDLERSTIVLLPRDGSPWRAISEGDAADQSPVFSPDGTRIAWWRPTQDGRMRIRIALVSGGPPGDVATVTATPEYFTRGQALAWTADGGSILAPHRPENGEDGLFQIPLDGSVWKRLTTPPPGSRDIAPRVSADGRRLAFLSSRGWLIQDICLMDLNPGAKVRCTPNPRLPKVFGLTWGPDDQTLIASMAPYQGVPDAATLWQLPVSNLLNGTEFLLQATQVVEPYYIPQLKTLIYSQQTWNGDLYEYSVTHGPVPKLSETRRIGPSEAFETNPVLSPDGVHLAYWSKRAGQQQLWVASGGGEEPRQHTHFVKEDLLGATWNPDSTSLAIVYSDPPNPNDNPSRNVAVVPLGGKAQSLLGVYDQPFRPVGWVRSGEWIYGIAQEILLRLNVRNGELEKCGEIPSRWIRYWPLRDEFWFRAKDGSYRILQGCGVSETDPVAAKIPSNMIVENLVPTPQGVWIQQPTRGKYFQLLFLPHGSSTPVRVEISRLLPTGIEASPDGNRLFLVRMHELRATPMLAQLE